MDFVHIILLLVLACCLYVWFVKPEILYKGYIRIATSTSRATLKQIQDSNGVIWAYLERGQRSTSRPSMLIIHGFSSRKEDWTPILKKLPSDQHIVVPDMPGHGKTDRVQLQDDVYDLFSKKLHQFVECVGLSSAPFHIAGLSMGGAITLCYSATFSQFVKGASVICPAIATPIPSEMKKMMISGKSSPLVDHSLEGFRNKLKILSYRKLRMPDQILKGVMAANKPYQDFFSSLYQRLNSPKCREVGLNMAEKIPCPTQVIWGQDDKMLHVSGAEALQERLPNLKALHILPRCGHAVMLDCPQQLTDTLLEFHRNIS